MTLSVAFRVISVKPLPLPTATTPVETRPYTHKTMVLAALEAGKHVMTEARMAMDATEANEMLQARSPPCRSPVSSIPAVFHPTATGSRKLLLHRSVHIQQPAGVL